MRRKALQNDHAPRPSLARPPVAAMDCKAASGNDDRLKRDAVQEEGHLYFQRACQLDESVETGKPPVVGRLHKADLRPVNVRTMRQCLLAQLRARSLRP